MTRKIALSCFCTFSKVLKSLVYLFFQIFTEKSKRMTASVENPFKHIVEPLDSPVPQQRFYNLCKLGDPRYGSSLMNHISVLFTSLRSMITKGLLCLFHVMSERLPFSIRILLESAVRNCDEFLVKSSDVENILNWKQTQTQSVEVPFRPARVILQDFTYVDISNRLSLY